MPARSSNGVQIKVAVARRWPATKAGRAHQVADEREQLKQPAQAERPLIHRPKEAEVAQAAAAVRPYEASKLDIPDIERDHAADEFREACGQQHAIDCAKIVHYKNELPFATGAQGSLVQ
eukprot:CAMPEP_0202787022 /NCGR_PEP_ID=MMETSP1388-20130828/71342_1 /ASSEMBLY_ACC=CAM_ASM_000864 /TAXON_ID=37098 /ORGANISM="Isochrysis sp, Strain CCMP1244" /LENGTH=119 /DNA_ID=CAMNT_0049456597 /DNA_START=247 /DNA_END=607 /DNA_ORIENTATION=-